MVALSMAVLLGFAAFATDVGIMLHEKRMIQSAADSAAVASAWALSDGTDASAAGSAAATANGFTAGTDSNGYTTTVNVYATPIDGHFKGKSGYTEAIISKQMPTFFMRIFGTDLTTVRARAVATDMGTADDCVRTTKPTGTTMQFQGSFHVIAPHCAVVNESKDPNALHFTGGAGSLIAGSVSVVGGDGGQTGDSTPTPTTGVAYTGDPLAGKFTPPDLSSSGVPCTATAPPAGTSASPKYIPNPTGTICYSSTGNISLTNVNLAPGLYIFNNPAGTLILGGVINGPMNSDGTPDTTAGDGVTIYLLGGMNETSGTVLTLSAPTSGDYRDLLLWGAVSDAPSPTAKLCPTGYANAGPGIIQLNLGTSSGNFTGLIYAPSSAMVFQDSGHDSKGPDLVTDLTVGTLCDETADLNITSFADGVDNFWFPKISLVE